MKHSRGKVELFWAGFAFAFKHTLLMTAPQQRIVDAKSR
jgi:hypothetical protein